MLINKPRVKVSRRDAFLAVFGVVYVLLGYSFLSVPDEYKPTLHRSLRLALDLAPIEAYGWAWVAAGAVALVSAAWRRVDAAGFAVATLVPVVWSGAYWAAWIQDGIPRAWVSGVMFAALGVAVSLVAGMYDPRRPPRRH